MEWNSSFKSRLPIPLDQHNGHLNLAYDRSFCASLLLVIVSLFVFIPATFPS